MPPRFDNPQMQRPGGEGRSRGRGGNRGRGRGRGGRGGTPEVEHEAAEVMAQLGISYGPYTPRGRGYHRGRRGSPAPSRGARGTPSMNGFVPGRGRGRGSGLGFTPPADAQSSMTRGGFGRGGAVGGRERPLLKPIAFVKSGLLFEHKEDIFAPESNIQEEPEDTSEWLAKTFERAVSFAAPGEDSEMQTASFHPPMPADKGSETDDDEEEIVYVPAMLRSKNASTAASSPLPPPHQSLPEDLAPRREASNILSLFMQEQVIETLAIEESSVNVSALVESIAQVHSAPSMSIVETSVLSTEVSIAVGQETPVSTSHDRKEIASVPPPSHLPPLAVSEEDVAASNAEEPRSAPAVDDLPSIARSPRYIPTFETFSFSPAFNPSPRKAVKLSRKEIKRQRRAAKRKQDKQVFLVAGSGLAPRTGDSDIEWGSDGPPQGQQGTHGAENDGGLSDGMEVDGDLDDAALRRFMKGLSAPEVTIDALDDEKKMKEEDDPENWTTDSDSEEIEKELEEALTKEELGLIGETSEDDETSDEESDGRPGPSGGFKARLQKARGGKVISPKNVVGKGKKKMNYDEEDNSEDEGVPFEGNFTWADRDEQYLGHIQDVLDQNAGVLHGRDRQAKKKLFTAIRDGDFGHLVDLDDALYGSAQVKKKKKADNFPAELHAQWDKDRAKKADYKRARALARKQAELDPFRARKGKNKNKTGRKRRHNPDDSDTSETDSEFAEPFEAITDLFSLERMIRVFLRDLGKTTMVLPSMDKESRRRVHLMSECFSLKSKSKGTGEARFPILLKTTRSGVNIDEQKVSRLLQAEKEAGIQSSMGTFFKAFNRARGSGPSKPIAGRHREGDIVGARAAKIGDGNIGYKLLQQMGWAEGDRIGLTGGIVDPLTAVIKTTKLGLGAAVR